MSQDESSSRSISLPVAVGGLVAGKYRVEGVLGRGGMGIVVAATDLELERRVAIKFVERKDEQAAARFLREARAAARVDSEHVTRVFDVGRLPHGAPFIVMERLEGEDLAERIAAGPLPVREAVGYLMQVCEALAQAHAARIVHRDLKPGNLFLHRRADGSRIVKVLDFGISKTLEGTVLTESQAIVGSPQYLAPEQIESPSRVDHRTDIWSLGVVAHELISGSRPFQGKTMVELCMNILGAEPPPLSSVIEDVPRPLDAVIACCLAKPMDARFASIAEVAEALAGFADAEGALLLSAIRRAAAATPAAEPSSPAPAAGAVADTMKHVVAPTRATMSRRQGWVIASLALACATAALFTLLSRGAPPRQPGVVQAGVLRAPSSPSTPAAELPPPAAARDLPHDERTHHEEPTPTTAPAPTAAAPAAPAELPSHAPPGAPAPHPAATAATPSAASSPSKERASPRSPAAPRPRPESAPGPRPSPQPEPPVAAGEPSTPKPLTCRAVEVLEKGRRVDPAAGRVTYEWARRACQAAARPGRTPYALSEAGISVKCACD